jgi:hypothetical protein
MSDTKNIEEANNYFVKGTEKYNLRSHFQTNALILTGCFLEMKINVFVRDLSLKLGLSIPKGLFPWNKQVE